MVFDYVWTYMCVHMYTHIYWRHHTITDPLWEESFEFPSHRVGNAELWYSLSYVKLSIELPMVWDPLSFMWRHCNVLTHLQDKFFAYLRVDKKPG